MKVYKVSPRTTPAASRPKILEAKTLLRQLWRASPDTPISFTRDPVSKALHKGLVKYPNATIYASRACRADIIQDIVETGAPFRQYHTTFLGNTSQSSIMESIDTGSPALFVASACLKTGTCDNITYIRDALHETHVRDAYIHLACDDVGGIMPFSPSRSLYISMDAVDSISCTSRSFGIEDTAGVLAGEHVRENDVRRTYVDTISYDSLRDTASCTYELTMAMFNVLFSHRIQCYLLRDSNVILVRAPESIRTTYGLELHDEWTCLRIPSNAEAGYVTTVMNDIIDYYNDIR